MSEAALSALAEAHSALDAALGRRDMDAIDAAALRFRDAIFQVRGVGVWRARPELARTAADLLARVEVSRQRVNELTRATRERSQVIDAARGVSPPLTYGRRA